MASFSFSPSSATVEQGKYVDITYNFTNTAGYSDEIYDIAYSTSVSGITCSNYVQDTRTRGTFRINVGSSVSTGNKTVQLTFYSDGDVNPEYYANFTIKVTAPTGYTINYCTTSTSPDTTRRQTVSPNASYSMPTNPTRSGYSFAGWASSNTYTVTWSTGTQTATANKTWYAVWQVNNGTRSETASLSHAFKATSSTNYSTASSTKTTNYSSVPVYYNCTLTSSQTSTSGGTVSSTTGTAISLPTAPTLSGFTFKGWTTSSTGTSATWSSGTVSPTSNTTYYAVWNGSVVTATGLSSDVSDYGDTIHAYKYATSDTVTASYSANRETYYTYNQGYYSQNHNYDRTSHAGGKTNSAATATYYRLVNNGSVGSWATSAPALKLTVPYTSATASGYTWTGWNTDAGKYASWTSGNKDVTSNTSFYGAWTDTAGTRSATATLTHTFYSTSSTAYTTKTNTKTTPYTGVTRYLNYKRNAADTATTGGTAGTATYTTVSLPTNPTLTNFTFKGWTTSSTGTSATWSSGTVSPTANTSYYAVWNGSVVTSTGNWSSATDVSGSTITINKYASSDTATATYSAKKQTRYQYDTGYYSQNHNYLLTSHAGSQTNSTAYNTQYRNVDNGTAGSWAASATVTCSVPYTSATLPGYTWQGWATSKTGTSASWTSGDKSLTSSTNYYGTWTDTGGTRSTSETLYHTFYTQPGSQWDQKTSTKTTNYQNVTRYFNYTRGTSSTATSGGTVKDTTYTNASLPTAPTKTNFTFRGWANASNKATVDWSSGTKQLTAGSSWYPIWSDTSGTHSVGNQTGTITHTFYKTSSSDKSTATSDYTYTKNYTGDTVYKNYDGSVTNNLKDSTTYTTTVNNYGALAWPNIYTTDSSTRTLESNTTKFMGWTTNGVIAVVWTKQTYTISSTTGLSFYSSWYRTNGTRSTTSETTYTHTFNETGTGSGKAETKTTKATTTTPYTGVTVKYNYAGTAYVQSDGTAGTPTTTYGSLTAPTPAYTQSGKTHEGWSNSSTGTSTTTVTAKPTSNTTWYAVWSDTSGTRTAAGSATITHYFRYQSTSDGTTKTTTDSYTRNWTGVKKYYNYTLSTSATATSGGTEGATTNHTYSAISAPSNPSRTDGYGFYGWSADGTTTTTTVSGNPTSSQTYYAVWYRQAQTKCYSATSTSVDGAVATSRCKYNGSITTITAAVAADATRTDYTFHSWYTGNISQQAASPTDKITDVSVTLTANTLLTVKNMYAVWKRSASLSGSYGGTSAVTSTATNYVGYDGSISSITVSCPAAQTKSGYTWYGWSTSSSVSSTPTTITSKSVSAGATDNIYATWYKTDGTHSVTGNKGTITHTFYKTSDTDKSNPTTQYTYTNNYTGDTVYYNYNVSSSYNTKNGSVSSSTITSYDNLPFPTSPTLTNYSFVGWTTSGTGTSASWTSGAKAVSSTTGQTWYAVWSDNSGTYTGTGSLSHTFYKSATSSSSVTTSYTKNYTGGLVRYNYTRSQSQNTQSGGTWTSSSNYGTLTAPGVATSQIGWSNSSSGVTTTTVTAKPTSDTSWYAVYEKTVTLSYTTTYGTAPSNQTTKRNYSYNEAKWSTVTFTLAAYPVSSGHLCKGWTIGSTNYTAGASYSNSANVTSISAVAAWDDGGFWIWVQDQNAWKHATPYIYNNGQWVDATPYIKGGNW